MSRKTKPRQGGDLRGSGEGWEQLTLHYHNPAFDYNIKPQNAEKPTSPTDDRLSSIKATMEEYHDRHPQNKDRRGVRPQVWKSPRARR